MHRKPNRDWLTAMLRPVSHMNRSPVPIPSGKAAIISARVRRGLGSRVQSLGIVSGKAAIISARVLDG